jgi:ABC-type transporter lipoprotein component MlaA
MDGSFNRKQYHYKDCKLPAPVIPFITDPYLQIHPETYRRMKKYIKNMEQLLKMLAYNITLQYKNIHESYEENGKSSAL